MSDIERRTIISDATVEYRDLGNGEKKPVIAGYAAVFNAESRNLGGFVETIHPNAFDEVLAESPDVIGVFNHDRNLLLGRTGNGTMKLTKDPYGLRYEITPNENTSIGRDVIEWVKDRTVVGSSFAFAIKRDGGDSWSTDHQRGIRKREVRAVGLLEDVGPVVRPAYDSSSVVVSRRSIEMALGEAFRPVVTMANAAKRGLKLAQNVENLDSRLLCIAERVANREIVSVEEVSYISGVYERCLAAKSTGWSGTPAWIEWQLAGGDAGIKWIQRRADEAAPKKDQIKGSEANEPDSAANKTGDITLDDSIVSALQAKADKHNEDMKSKSKPEWTRVRVGSLKAVYRRGAGAFSTSHRPGMTRGQWAMARVNAFLYLSEHGSPENEKYTSDNDLLAGGHPKHSDNRDVSAEEVRAENEVNLVPTAGMAAAAKRGLALHEAGRSGDGLKPETVARANKIAARDELTPEHVREMRAWFRRHKVDKKAGWSKSGEETPGYTAWMLWGGDPAWRWSEAKVAQMERASGQRDVVEGEIEEEYSGVLSPRQLAEAECYEGICEEYGPWEQDDAHYLTENPFASNGVNCGNCVFFEGEEGRCYVVQGAIAADAVCKLWVIPEERMSEEKKPEPAPEMPAAEPPAERSRDEGEEIAVKIAELKATILRTKLHAASQGQ